MSDDVETVAADGSSNVYEYAYSPKSGTLRVTFRNKAGGRGDVYEYKGVPDEVFRQMRKVSDTGESVGKFIHQRIKGYFDGAKIEG